MLLANAATTGLEPLDSSTASVALISVNGPLTQSECNQISVCYFTATKFYVSVCLFLCLCLSLPSSVVSFMFLLLCSLWAGYN